MGHRYNRQYTGRNLERISFPLGGIGAGMICLEGTGAIGSVSIRHRPEIFNEPLIFAALGVKRMPDCARLLEGPVPAWKLVFPWGREFDGAGNGAPKKAYGLPRFEVCSFMPRFPFAEVRLSDRRVPVTVRLTGWSPFTPPDPDRSSLPVAALEYELTNTAERRLETVFSFHAEQFLAEREAGADSTGPVGRGEDGFVLRRKPDRDGASDCLSGATFRVSCGEPGAEVRTAWFRGGWFDAKTMLWNRIRDAEIPEPCEGDAVLSRETDETPDSAGGSLYLPVSLGPGETRTVTVRLSWYTPESRLVTGLNPDGSAGSPAAYSPWYAGAFQDDAALEAYWKHGYAALRAASAGFRDALFSTTLPPEAIEAVSANLSILKSPTVLRQRDGRFWAWEGCHDTSGCCPGSCTHVWNYAQAAAQLFPSLERTLRETEFRENQCRCGHQHFRANLPIRPTDHGFHAAADGQLGGIMKLYRDWRNSGSDEWLASLWPRAKRSLRFCIELWDPAGEGLVRKPHHNTYDIEFHGPDSMCGSIYLGALKAASLIASHLGDPEGETFRRLYGRGREAMERTLFDGTYFIQRVEPDPAAPGSPVSAEEAELVRREGPKYQIGSGCLSDGVIGAWLAELCGLGEILDPLKVESHLKAVHRHNFKPDLSGHANPQRGTYAAGTEGGLVLCTWPNGGKPSLPFVYSDEVWTGVEYQAASHMAICGLTGEGLEIVRAVRDRYDGTKRNPFDEYECGHYYARALSSYALIRAFTGVSYDSVTRTLTIAPPQEGDVTGFLCTGTGYGLAGVRNGKPFFELRSGSMPVGSVRFTPAGPRA